MTHALATDAGMRHLDATSIADDSLVLRALELAARALPVPFRSKDSLTEKSVLLRAIGTVVNRLRFLHFAERPASYVVWRRQ